MIIFTKFYDANRNTDSGVLARVLGYVKSKTTLTDEKYKGLLWGTGRRVTLEDLKNMEAVFNRSGLTRMIVFSPVRWLDASVLNRYTMETMWQFLKSRNFLGMMFAYGLHYNTNHPHTHVIITSYYEKENRFERADIRLLQDIAHRVFEEPIGSMAYEVYPEYTPQLEEKKVAHAKKEEEYDKALKRKVMEIKDHFELELKDASEFNEVANIEDVYEMEV